MTKGTKKLLVILGVIVLHIALDCDAPELLLIGAVLVYINI